MQKKFLVFFVFIALICFSVLFFYFNKPSHSLSVKGVKNDACKGMSEDEVIAKSRASKDLSLCNCLGDEAKKKDCLALPNDDAYAAAIGKLDAKECSKIQNKELGEQCRQNAESYSASLASQQKAANASTSRIYMLKTEKPEIEKFENLLKGEKDNIGYKIQLALSYGAKSLEDGEFRKEVKDRVFFNKALALMDEVDKQANDKTQSEWVRAHLYGQNFLFDDAMSHLEAAIAESPDDFRLYLTLSQTQYQKKDYAAAIKSVEKGLALLGKSGLGEAEKTNITVEFYCVLVGVYHQTGDSAKEEKYKEAVSGMMVKLQEKKK